MSTAYNSKRKAPDADHGDDDASAGQPQSKRARGALGGRVLVADPIRDAYAQGARATIVHMAARAAIARAIATADVDDLPLFPHGVRAAGGGRFPWHAPLQFVAARDRAALARTHRAARDVLYRRATFDRALDARYRGGCRRTAKDRKAKCKCAGCARVDLLRRVSAPRCWASTASAVAQDGKEGADFIGAKVRLPEWYDEPARVVTKYLPPADPRNPTEKPPKWEVRGEDPDNIDPDNIDFIKGETDMKAALRRAAVWAACTKKARWLRRLHRVEGAVAAGLTEDKGGAIVQITGATHGAHILNGVYDLREGGECPAYLRRFYGGSAGPQCGVLEPRVWLYLCVKKQWTVSIVDEAEICARGDACIAYSTAAVDTAAVDGGAPPLPHTAEAGKWLRIRRENGDDGWAAHSTVVVRAIARAEADRLEAAAAAAWDAAAARGPATVTIAGATGPHAYRINGFYDRVPDERGRGAPVYHKKELVVKGEPNEHEDDNWLFLACGNRWFVGSTNDKDARHNQGSAATENSVADGTLPHEAPGRWKAWGRVVDGGWPAQPALTVRGVTKAEADRLKAEAEAATTAAWDAAVARGPAEVVISGFTVGPHEKINGVFDHVPGERTPGGAPVYQKRRGEHDDDDDDDPDDDGSVFLYLSRSNTWVVGSCYEKDKREATGCARANLDPVADGTLPHEFATAGTTWDVWDTTKGYPSSWKTQAGGVTVTAARDDRDDRG